MLRTSHLAVGGFSWGAASYMAVARGATDGLSMTAAAACAIAGSVGPDADLTFPLKLVTHHRGVTHSLFAVVVVTLLAGFVASKVGLDPVWVGSGMGWGWMSHLLADTCTPHGVPYLWPAKHRYSWNLFPTGSVRELLMVVAWCAACLVAVGLQAKTGSTTPQAQP